MNLTRTATFGAVVLSLLVSCKDLYPQSKPVTVGEIRNIGQPLTTSVNSVAAGGRYAWIGTTNGLFIYDVSTPSAPVYVGQEQSPRPGAINRIVLSGSYAYLANVGLRIVDTSTPEQPYTLSYIDQANNGTNGLAMDLAVAAPYVYLANGADGLRIYDVSDVYSPTNIGHWPNPNRDLGSFRMGIEVQGNYAYLAAYNDGLRVFDVSDPRNPQSIAHIPDQAATKVAIQGKRLYLISDGLYVFDISNPAEPVLLGDSKDAPSPRGVCVDGNFVYVASSGYTLFGPYFYDASNDASLIRLAPKNDVQSAQGVWDMTMANNQIYMVLDFGVGIYSLGSAESPPLNLEKGEGRSVVLSWPAPSFAFVPQTSPTVGGTNWTTVADAEVTTTNGLNKAVLPIGKESGFYRIIRR